MLSGGRGKKRVGVLPLRPSRRTRVKSALLFFLLVTGLSLLAYLFYYSSSAKSNTRYILSYLPSSLSQTSHENDGQDGDDSFFTDDEEGDFEEIIKNPFDEDDGQTTPAKSSFACRRGADWMEICRYKFMCTDGLRLVLFDDTMKERKDFDGKNPYLDSVNWEPYPVPIPPPYKGNPIHFETKALGYWLPRSHIDDKKVNIQWLDGTMWLVGPESPDTWNPWHFIISLMPMWTLQFLNKTGHSGPDARLFGAKPLPPIDYVFMLDPIHNKNDHNMLMSQWAAQNHTKFYWWEDVSKDGKFVADPTRIPPNSRHARDRPKLPTLTLNTDKGDLLCAREGFMSSYKYTLFSGPAETLAFREKVFGLYGLAFKPPPKYVLIVNRGDRGRAFFNPKEIIRVVHEVLGLPYRYIWDPDRLPLEDQIRAFHGAGLSIHPHGAGITNIIFQQPKSAVIEIFPYNHHQAAFSQLAMAARVLHFPIYTYVKNRSLNYNSPEPDREETCKTVNVYELGFTLDCLHPLLGSMVMAPSDILEMTVVTAMRAIGHPMDITDKLRRYLAYHTDLQSSFVPRQA